ncbi:hypothetical protein DH86_00002812 [Scytalidium sp. 3C]|nr:hypothetical protein DH86_00002812 [Scytalidium sp. 3C]
MITLFFLEIYGKSVRHHHEDQKGYLQNKARSAQGTRL